MKKLTELESVVAIATALLSAAVSWGVANATVNVKIQQLEKQGDYRDMQFDKMVEKVNMINDRTIRIETSVQIMKESLN